MAMGRIAYVVDGLRDGPSGERISAAAIASLLHVVLQHGEGGCNIGIDAWSSWKLSQRPSILCSSTGDWSSVSVASSCISFAFSTLKSSPFSSSSASCYNVCLLKCLMWWCSEALVLCWSGEAVVSRHQDFS